MIFVVVEEVYSISPRGQERELLSRSQRPLFPTTPPLSNQDFCARKVARARAMAWAVTWPGKSERIPVISAAGMTAPAWTT